MVRTKKPSASDSGPSILNQPKLRRYPGCIYGVRTTPEKWLGLVSEYAVLRTRARGLRPSLSEFCNTWLIFAHFRCWAIPRAHDINVRLTGVMGDLGLGYLLMKGKSSRAVVSCPSSKPLRPLTLGLGSPHGFLNHSQLSLDWELNSLLLFLISRERQQPRRPRRNTTTCVRIHPNLLPSLYPPIG